MISISSVSILIGNIITYSIPSLDTFILPKKQNAAFAGLQDPVAPLVNLPEVTANASIILKKRVFKR